jgi:cytochrome c-type biogenesis protein
MEFSLFNLLILPVGLGLFGFIEPCSIGSSLIFIKYLVGKSGTRKFTETVLFAFTRALFIGALGMLSVLVGSAFLGFQRGAWIVLGTVYVAIGFLYLFGRAGFLMRSIGPRLTGLNSTRGSVGLGLIFGLNIPACAAPLLLVLLGVAAAGGWSGNALLGGLCHLPCSALPCPCHLSRQRYSSRRASCSIELRASPPKCRSGPGYCLSPSACGLSGSACLPLCLDRLDLFRAFGRHALDQAREPAPMGIIGLTTV